MEIEPCPFCGVNFVRLYYHKAPGGPEWVECANCHAKGDKRALKQDAIDSWNRLSRIVRAAEDWVREEKIPGNLSKIQEAEDALRNAVEGGRADG